MSDGKLKGEGVLSKRLAFVLVAIFWCGVVWFMLSYLYGGAVSSVSGQLPQASAPASVPSAPASVPSAPASVPSAPASVPSAPVDAAGCPSGVVFYRDGVESCADEEQAREFKERMVVHERCASGKFKDALGNCCSFLGQNKETGEWLCRDVRRGQAQRPASVPKVCVNRGCMPVNELVISGCFEREGSYRYVFRVGGYDLLDHDLVSRGLKVEPKGYCHVEVEGYTVRCG